MCTHIHARTPRLTLSTHRYARAHTNTYARTHARKHTREHLNLLVSHSPPLALSLSLSQCVCVCVCVCVCPSLSLPPTRPPSPSPSVPPSYPRWLSKGKPVYVCAWACARGVRVCAARARGEQIGGWAGRPCRAGSMQVARPASAPPPNHPRRSRAARRHPNLPPRRTASLPPSWQGRRRGHGGWHGVTRVCTPPLRCCTPAAAARVGPIQLPPASTRLPPAGAQLVAVRSRRRACPALGPQQYRAVPAVL